MGAPAVAVAARRRILLVDDVELNRTLTEAVLRGATYDVDCADSGTSALSALERKDYDLVLMDLEMPDIGGHEAATRIRKRHKGPPLRLAALSSRGGDAARSRSREVGMAAHITRPIAPHALLREIERVFCHPAATEAADPWQRQSYEDWVARLGADRMDGVLVKLLGQFRHMLAILADAEGDEVAIHRLAHDVASTGGMLGFLDVTRCCRAISEPAGDGEQPAAKAALIEALERAGRRLENHLLESGHGAGAA